jgi:integrase
MTDKKLSIRTVTILENAKQQLSTLTAMENESFHLLNETWEGESNPANQYLSKFNGTSKSTHISRLKRLARMLGNFDGNYLYLNWRYFTALRIEAFIKEMYEPYYEKGVLKRKSPNTINGYLDTLKGVMKRAFKSNIIDQKEWVEIADIRSLKNNLPPAGRMAEPEETAKILESLNDKRKENAPKAARDTAIFKLGFLVGIRRHEYSLLVVSDFDSMNKKLLIKGKGGKVVNQEISDEVADAIEDWLMFRGREEGCLFFSISKNGNITDKPLTESSIRYLYSSYGLNAGIKKLTSHDARRTFSSNVLDDPHIDPKTAMDLLRHSSFDTSAKYDRRSGRKRNEVVNRLKM